MSVYQKISKELVSLSNKEKAIQSQRFFKSGKGEYGEGDKFLGITVPNQRTIANQYFKECDKESIVRLLEASFHEERLTGLLILVNKYNHAAKSGAEKEWVDLYLNLLHRVNNWDLVDSSAHFILGRWLYDKDRTILYDLAKSSSLWDNRVAMIATFYYIRKNDIKDTLRISKMMLQHPHDLIHKASGWMLREAWQKQPEKVEEFLNQYATVMPRTMLRYVIEKMPVDLRKYYLTKKV